MLSYESVTYELAFVRAPPPPPPGFPPSSPGSPPRVQGRPGRVRRIHRGETLRLKCPVVGSGPFSVEWFKDDDRVDPTTWRQHSVSGRDGRVLRVRRVGPDAAGIYTCKVRRGIKDLC